MRTLVITILLLGMVAEMYGQIVIPLRTRHRDGLGQSAYDDMEEDYDKIKNQALRSAVIINTLETIIRERNESMELPRTLTTNLKTRIENFIWAGGASPSIFAFAVPGTPAHYIREKYPITPIANTLYGQPSAIFKNNMIVRRFGKKLITERDEVGHYMGERKTAGGPYLFIPEGYRMMLTLDSLYEVIDITLENERW